MFEICSALLKSTIVELVEIFKNNNNNLFDFLIAHLRECN